jgi:hypothetical protein
MDERYLRSLHILVTDEDLLQFKDLWKVMLLASLPDDFSAFLPNGGPLLSLSKT